MSKLDRAISAQRATLARRQQSLRQQRQELRDGARHFCGKPSTLFSAFLAGAVLGVIFPPRSGGRPARSRLKTEVGSILRHNMNASLQLLIVNTVVRLFAQLKRRGDEQKLDPAIL